MKTQTTIIITIAFVIMVIVSVAVYSTFSFAVSTNSMDSQSTTNAMTVPSQISPIPVAHNGTLASGGATAGDPCYAMEYLWDHVYGKVSHKYPSKHRFVDSGGDYGKCITVTGIVLSAEAHKEENKNDGDLHIELQLDRADWQYTSDNNKHDKCFHKGEECRTLVVEVICWQRPSDSYVSTFALDYNNKSYCEGVDNRHLGLVSKGDILKVSGKFVKDIDETSSPSHPAWNEIHPVTYIEFMGRAT
jgi:hypothetical protein